MKKVSFSCAYTRAAESMFVQAENRNKLVCADFSFVAGKIFNWKLPVLQLDVVDTDIFMILRICNTNTGSLQKPILHFFALWSSWVLLTFDVLCWCVFVLSFVLFLTQAFVFRALFERFWPFLTLLLILIGLYYLFNAS